MTQDRLRSIIGATDDRASTAEALEPVARARLMANDTEDLDDAPRRAGRRST